MTNTRKYKNWYKGFHGDKNEYIEFCIDKYKYWTKVTYETFQEDYDAIYKDVHPVTESALRLSIKFSKMLIEEGFTPKDIEMLEIEASKEFRNGIR
jgi:RNA binding exosome subunit